MCVCVCVCVNCVSSKMSTLHFDKHTGWSQLRFVVVILLCQQLVFGSSGTGFAKT